MDQANMNFEMMNLFAVPVYKSSLQRTFTEQELQFFQQQLADPVAAVSNQSSRNKNVLDASEMKGLRFDIQQCINHYFTLVHNTANQVAVDITQSWLSVTRRGESHHTHSHPNSVFSGVLYIKLAEQDGINFFRNDDMWWYELIPKEHNYYNAHRYLVETQVGDIIIFPSNVKHGVKEVVSDVERVSLAFNTFFTGELGRGDFSNALIVKSN